jgi:hypothetical protein
MYSLCESRSLSLSFLLDCTDMTASDVAPGTKDTPSLKTEKSLHESPELRFVPGHEESEDKKEEILDDNWESDPENARNWSTFKKWGSMLIVRVVHLVCLLTDDL